MMYIRKEMRVYADHQGHMGSPARGTLSLVRHQWVCLRTATDRLRALRTRASSSFDSNSPKSAFRISHVNDGGRSGAVLSDERMAVGVVDHVKVEDLSIGDLCDYVSDLVVELQSLKTYEEKLKYVLGKMHVQLFLQTEIGQRVISAMPRMNSRQAYCILCLIEIGQKHVLSGLRDKYDIDSKEEENGIVQLSKSLEPVEEFYDSIGGLAGYQLQCLHIIADSSGEVSHNNNENNNMIKSTTNARVSVDMLVPKGLDIRSPDAKISVAEGIKAIGSMAEIYPLGGAGDRLGLQCEDTGDSLPSAVLPYCGRSLLEHLIRDVQGREYLHFCLYGEQHTMPIAVMTSLAKGNHSRVVQLFEANSWFGRGCDSFKLFQQPMVPMVKAHDGKWALDGPCNVIMKPGGHGVIWKLMLDNGVFDWLKKHSRESAIVRQISNPMAGQDRTLLALGGHGVSGNKAFGFASCERVVGAAEGMNVVLKETIRNKDGTQKSTFRLSNVEYTEFSKMGIEDKGVNGSSYSLFPANTNVLYLGLKHVENMVRKSVASGTTEAILPGMILNLNKSIAHVNVESGEEECVPAGRLECTMQNLADCFVADAKDSEDYCSSLPTFLVYGPRRKVTSSAKRKRKPGSLKIHQTPDGSFYDLQQNAKAMMEQCGMMMPDVGSVEHYLAHGPGFIFLFHPALGPLWDIVAQKIIGGRMHEQAEIQLEIAEASLHNIDVDGSLLVTAEAVMGKPIDGRLAYSRHECARISLENVTIRNKGVDFDNPHNVYWRHRVKRRESCRIHLLGRSEFEARNVTFVGDQDFIVPDGYRMVVTPREDDEDDRLQIDMIALGDFPSWMYIYSLEDDIILEKKVLSS